MPSEPELETASTQDRTLPAHIPYTPATPEVTLRVYDEPAIRANGPINISDDPHAGYCAQQHTGTMYDDKDRNSGAPDECESVFVTWHASESPGRVDLWAVLVAPDGSYRFPVDLGNVASFGQVGYGKSPWPELWEPGTYHVMFAWTGAWNGTATASFTVAHEQGACCTRHATESGVLVQGSGTVDWAGSSVQRHFVGSPATS